MDDIDFTPDTPPPLTHPLTHPYPTKEFVPQNDIRNGIVIIRELLIFANFEKGQIRKIINLADLSSLKICEN